MATPWYKRLFAWIGKQDREEESHEWSTTHHEANEEFEIPRKAGKFRFPIIPDEEIPASRLIEQPDIKPTSRADALEGERKKLLQEREELFNKRGWLHKAQDVPSPIYGFNPPPENRFVRVEEGPSEEASNEVIEINEAVEAVEVIEVTPIKQEVKVEDAVDDAETDSDASSCGKEDSHKDIDPLEEQAQEEVQEEMYTVEVQPLARDENTESMPSEAPTVQSAKTEEKPVSHIPYNVFNYSQPSTDTYQFPKFQFLLASPPVTQEDREWLEEMVDNLENTLLSFNVQAKVVGITRGPTVTRMELQPAPGVKVNRITNLSDDIKLNLAAKDIRIEAPVPGKSAVGIEIPNLVREPVNIVDILSSAAFRDSKSPLSVALGKDIEGKPVVIDLRKMPHGLIAGSTGSGKSVCINSIIISLLYKAKPEEVKMILIDPKMVELAPYHDLPHLATPVVTDPKQATMALKWAVEEMDRRYELFAQSGVRDLDRYNQLMAETKPEVVKPALPYILIIIDELADLMMVAPGDVEESIARIAQKARACGIHLLVATQRPSVDVITGMIKANIPTRVAFSVSSQVDSRTILDSVGAERLLGRGDMLLMENGSNKAVRVQGNYVDDEEIEAVCRFVRSQRKPKFLFDKESLVKSLTEEPEDDLFHEAVQFIIEQENASTSLLQRKFRIGYNRAARLIDMMEERGMISAAAGSKPRNVLVTQEEYEELVQA